MNIRFHSDTGDLLAILLGIPDCPGEYGIFQVIGRHGCVGA